MTKEEAIKAIEWQRKYVSGRFEEALDIALSIMRNYVPDPDTRTSFTVADNVMEKLLRIFLKICTRNRDLLL